MEKTTREYNMEKILNLRQEEDESTKLFDDAQDAYATEMYDFLSKEQLYTQKIQELVMLQITHYKNAAVQLEGMLPRFEKRMSKKYSSRGLLTCTIMHTCIYIYIYMLYVGINVMITFKYYSNDLMYSGCSEYSLNEQHLQY